MRLFSKIRCLFGDHHFQYLLRNSLLSVTSFRIFVITFYDLSVKLIYFKLEGRFKYKKWFKAVQFKNNRYLLSLIQGGRSEFILDRSKWDHIPTREIELCSSRHQDLKIKFASRYLPYSDDLFCKKFADNEDTFSVHRFKWLLILIQESPVQNAVNLGYNSIELWLESFREVSDPKIFESYSISDRLLNWLFFIIFTKEYSKKGDIFWENLSRSYEFQLNHLINNLEYHWRNTNNHILNNACCLYICGALLNIKQVKKIGQEILFVETDKMIKNGVLQEESSHYQMLLTRSYLEMLYVAKISNDYEMIAWLSPRVSQMLEVCDLLQSKFETGEYPLFGDVSPDVFPEWMLGRPFSRHSKKNSPWQKLFRMEGFIDHIAQQQMATVDNDIINKWHYLSNRNFEVWIYAKKHNGVSHGHADNGSIVIFNNGNPILIDLGRYNYTKDSRNIFQRSQEAHNIPMIDDLFFDFSPSSLFKTDRFSSRCDVVELTDNAINYVLLSFDRQIRLNRQIALNDDAVIIEDTVKKANSKTKNIDYANNWYIVSEYDFMNNLTLIKSLDGPLEFAIHALGYPVQQMITHASRCARYGESSPAFHLSVFTLVDLNQPVRTILKKASDG